MDWDAFLTLHAGLPREGPGQPGDVAWAIEQAGLSGALRVLDAGCGPGADLETLAEVLPEARITGVDMVSGFVADARRRTARFGDRVEVVEGDMQSLDGPFDLIWCAGALYFLGLADGVQHFAARLVPGGVLAFTEPCAFQGAAGADAQALFGEYPLRSPAAIAQAVEGAGLAVLAQRALGDGAWEAYLDPLVARAGLLRATADRAVSEVLDEAEREAKVWRRIKDHAGYLLSVARAPGGATTA